MADRISRFPVPELADPGDDVRERILSVQEKPDSSLPFLMLAHRPEFRAFLITTTLMEKNEGLTKAERKTMIVVATSGAGNCLYCVVAHGAVLRIRARMRAWLTRLATNYRRRKSPPPACDARLRHEAVDQWRRGSKTPTWPCCAGTVLTTRRSGTSARLPPFSP